MFCLKGKVALVTGSSRGIGRGIALALAEAGADVVINCMGNVAAAEEVAEKVRGFGRKALVLKADVSDAVQVQELFGKISSGRIVQLKNLAREVMAEENIMARDSYSVNTEAAYRAWGLDIKDLENRYSKLQALKEKESKS